MSSKIRASVLRDCGLTAEDIPTEVSYYAATNPKEWFAESFAEYIESPTPRKAAIAFGKRLEELLKGID